MAFILHLDTSGPACIVMLAKDGLPVASRRSEGERDHAGHINRLVAEVLEDGGIGLSGIDAVAVCNGPGSYTGLRIGLATAKGYCYVLGKQLILHNRLTLMLREVAAEVPLIKNVIAILPARSGEYYAAAAGPSLIRPPEHITTVMVQSLSEQVREDLCMIGKVGDDLLSFISSNGIKLIEHHNLDQNAWASVASDDFSAGTFADVAYASPEYLKQAYINTKASDSKNS